MAEQPRRALCPGCARPTRVCLCSALPTPPLRTTTRVLILRHPKEAKRKVVKTADLVGLCLAEGCCEIATAADFGPVLRAQQQAAAEAGSDAAAGVGGAGGVGPGGVGPRWLLLWPGQAATALDALAPPAEPEPEPVRRPCLAPSARDPTPHP